MEKIVLIGAGSQNFGLGIISDIFKSGALDGCEIFLHDICLLYTSPSPRD